MIWLSKDCVDGGSITSKGLQYSTSQVTWSHDWSHDLLIWHLSLVFQREYLVGEVDDDLVLGSEGLLEKGYLLTHRLDFTTFSTAEIHNSTHMVKFISATAERTKHGNQNIEELAQNEYNSIYAKPTLPHYGTW